MKVDLVTRPQWSEVTSYNMMSKVRGICFKKL